MWKASFSKRFFFVKVVNPSRIEGREHVMVVELIYSNNTAAFELVALEDEFLPQIFADGFESGDTSVWSLTVPYGG